MPGKVKVKIIAGKNLPVMDRSSDTTDAYVEIKLGSTTYKTDVCRKSLNPQWNSDWYRFEVDDSELQDEPLQIRLMDYDTYSANDAIGKVYLDLNPLLLPGAAVLPKLGWGGEPTNNSEHVTNSVLSGWFPVYDTMHGIRGEVNIIVKVELFSDFNRFRQSSCGVQFFCSPVIPHGYYVQMYHGFVEELIVNDDPEYQWIDKIRTPRASNEARQTKFFKLAGELQRKIGVKALELGGNAVVGYSQCFDLEGELGIVVRGTGTAVTLIKVRDAPPAPAIDITTEERAQSYLHFLRQYNNFHLNRENLNKLVQPVSYPYRFQFPPDYANDQDLQAKRSLTRHLSYGDFSPPSKSTLSLNRPVVENIHHASSLQTLLRQEDLRGHPGSGISQRLKNFKYSSQSILAKKMTALKAKLSDSGMLEEDDVDPALSPSQSRLSLLEGIKKKPVIYQRSTSESSAMAQLLVHSLMHASLDCIAETHDSSTSRTSSPKVELESTFKSDSTANEINEPIHLRSKSLSPQLLEPGLMMHMNMSSSNTESSCESSSDEDESISDVPDDTNLEYDTVSNIIKNVIITPEKQSEGALIPTRNYELSNKPLTLESQIETVDEQFDTVSTNDVPPLAEFESFAIEENSPVHFFLEDEDNYSYVIDEDDGLEKVTKSEQISSEPQPESIIPPINVSEGTVNSQNLVQTAMQTILFENLKLVGTYTPPSSPSVANKEKGMFNFDDPKTSVSSSKQKKSFFPNLTNVLETIQKSPIIGRSSKTTINENEADQENIGSVLISLKNSSDPNQMKVPSEESSDQSETKYSTDSLKINKDAITMEKGESALFTESEIHCEESTKIDPAPCPASSYLINTNSDKKFNFNASTSTSCLKAIPDNLPVNSELDQGNNNMHASLAHSLRTVGSPGTEPTRNDHGHQRTESFGTKISQSPARFHPIPFMHRRSSDSDLSITPKGNSLTGSDKSGGLASGYFSRMGTVLRPTIPQDNFDMLEYPFITMSKYPPGFIIYLGGVVSARSVKLLERITNLEEPESRDTWWTELRMEIRSHARALNCNAVLAYCETSSICDDVCVLSASGTAAVIGFQYTGEIGDSIAGLPLIPKPHYGTKDLMASSLDRNDFEREKVIQKPDSILLSNIGINSKPLPESPENETQPAFVNSLSPCTVCHLPYTGNSVPLRTIMLKCALCRIGKVPEILLSTIELPEGTPTLGRGCFIQAYVCRQLKDLRSESNAKDISDRLPFLEYELHRILVNKIRIKGMNAVFGLKVTISIGTKMLVGIATGTGVFLLPLPPPPLPKLVSVRSTDEKQLAEMQQLLSDTVEANKEIYQLKTSDDSQNIRMSPDTEHLSEEEQPFLDLSSENRDCCILEVDDPEDMEIMNLLMEPRPPDGFHVVNTELVPGLEEMEIVKNLQMFTQIWRSKIQPPYNFAKHVHKLLQSVYFKLRRMIPCALCDLKFRVDLPESDEIQLTVLGMALGLGEPQKVLKYKRKNMHVPLKDSLGKNDDDMIFNLEEDVESTGVPYQSGTTFLNVQPIKHRTKSPHRAKMSTSKQQAQVRERHGIDITPLSYVPGGKIERYLGNLNFFFIRETTSIREEGGLSGFIHSFIAEVLAIVRAHIAALGGNAMVAYYMTECVLSHNLHKNQGQCLINVGGDVVFVSYFTEE